MVEDTEVRELIWDKSNAAQGKGIQKKLPLEFHSLSFRDSVWNNQTAVVLDSATEL